MCASIGVTGYPRSGKLPAPLCHRSPTPIQAVRGGRLTLAAASRCSKICPIDRPRQHAYKHRCDRIPKVRQTARAVVPSLSGTLADCARPRGRSLDTKDCAIKKCSARLLTDPQERLPAKVEYALRANTWVLACVRLWLHHRSWLPVFHPVSGTKHGRPFREIDGRTLLAPALTSCRARLWFWMVCRPFEPCSYARSRERKIGEYGAGTDPKEREWQPYMSIIRLIRMGSSGDNLESVDFSYGRRRTEPFGHWKT
jgi:hypothetical protein